MTLRTLVNALLRELEESGVMLTPKAQVLARQLRRKLRKDEGVGTVHYRGGNP